MHRLSQHFQDMNDFSGFNFLGSTFWFTLYGLTGDFLSLICIMDGERMLCLDLRRNLKGMSQRKRECFLHFFFSSLLSAQHFH